MMVTIILRPSSKLWSQLHQIPNKKTFRNRPNMVEVVTLMIDTEAPTISQWDLPLTQPVDLLEDKINPPVRAFGCRTMLSNEKERSHRTKMPIEKTTWETRIMAQENHMGREAMTNIAEAEWTQARRSEQLPTHHLDMKSHRKEKRLWPTHNRSAFTNNIESKGNNASILSTQRSRTSIKGRSK